MPPLIQRIQDRIDVIIVGEEAKDGEVDSAMRAGWTADFESTTYPEGFASAEYLYGRAKGLLNLARKLELLEAQESGGMDARAPTPLATPELVESGGVNLAQLDQLRDKVNMEAPEYSPGERRVSSPPRTPGSAPSNLFDENPRNSFGLPEAGSQSFAGKPGTPSSGGKPRTHATASSSRSAVPAGMQPPGMQPPGPAGSGCGSPLGTAGTKSSASTAGTTSQPSEPVRRCIRHENVALTRVPSPAALLPILGASRMT